MPSIDPKDAPEPLAWADRGESYRLIPLHRLEEAFGVDRETVERAIGRLGYLYRQLACDPAESKRQREAGKGDMAELDYVYRVVDSGFERGVFDFSVLRRRAHEYVVAHRNPE